MEKWEHRTVYISRIDEEWAVQFGDGDLLKGMDRILDEYGARGWELLAFVPHSWKTQAGQYGPFEVTAYRAVFKRPVGAASSPPSASTASAAAPSA